MDSWCTGDHLWYVTKQIDKRRTPQLHWQHAKDLIRKTANKPGHYLIMPHHRQDQPGLKVLDALDFIKAKIENGRLYPISGGSMLENRVKRSIPRFFTINDDFLYMLGIYLAEGDSTGGGSTFNMNIKERPYLERIRLYLDSILLESYYNKVKKGKLTLVLRTNSSVFGKLMTALCGKLAQNKMINPKLFQSLSHEQKYEIFKAWHIGDGVKTNNPKMISGSSISETLILQMKMILEANHVFARVYKEKKSDRAFSPFQICAWPNDFGAANRKGVKNLKDDRYIYIPLNEIQSKEYSGPVVDIQVSDVFSFMTPNGVAHNCRIYSITPDEEFKPRYERLKVLYQDRLDAVFMDQCKLPSVMGGRKPTIKDTTEWWASLVKIEEDIGIERKRINDSPGGSYRTYPEHIILHVFSDKVVEMLQTLRVHGNKFEKKQAIDGLISGAKGKLKSLAKT